MTDMTRPSSPFANLADALSHATDAAAAATRQWSDEQSAVFDWFASPSPIARALVVEALAGTGKTTTILEAISRAPEDRILLCAFNKRIADELKSRITHPGATAMTLHGLGYQILRAENHWGRNVRVDQKGDRKYDLARAVCGPSMPDAVMKLVANLHTKIREIAPEILTVEDALPLAIAYDCVPDREWQRMGHSPESVCAHALEACDLAARKVPAKGIDFADMLFLPVRKGWGLTDRDLFDLIVVDEAQDMSRAQLTIAQSALRPGGRIVIVGDKHQAIYGFRGADSGSLDRLRKELDADILTLRTTYRCAKSVVVEAQRFVPAFTAAEKNPSGEVRQARYDELLQQARPGDFVLSRTNAPLVKTAFAFLRAGKRARIEGRDIGKGLMTIIDKVSKRVGYSAAFADWVKGLRAWSDAEIEIADAAGLTGKVSLILDQEEMLLALAEGVTSVAEIQRRIADLFDDVADRRADFIILSSVHKAKGLEAQTVWCLRDTFGLTPACQCGHRHQYGKDACGRCDCRQYRANPMAAKEELNIEYVAVTRAIQTLVWVDGAKEAR